MHTQKLQYFDGTTPLEAFIAFEEKITAKRPVVIIFHAWRGKDEFVCNKAIELAELGYVGFAADVYGQGVFGSNKEECGRLMAPFVEDRLLLRSRVARAFEEAKKLSVADERKIGAMGFCFGGLCALDLARSGLDVKAVVSFHGLLNPPTKVPEKKIVSKILALHGNDDPMVSLEEQEGFKQEMTKHKVDWQMHIYGNAMHAFTNPDAHDPGFGTVYNQAADRRSWVAMKDFFQEVFG